MSEQITSTVWGIAPWSGELLKVSGDVDRGRLPAGAGQEQVTRDHAEYASALEVADITYRSGDWGGTKDYFRDTVFRSRGFEDGISQAPVTRWFDTNTFYRQPTIQGPLNYWSAGDHGYYQLLLQEQGSSATYQPTLLSPYAFTKLAACRAGLKEDDAHRLVGDLYDQLLDDAKQQEVGQVLLHEPYAPYHRIEGSERRQLQQHIGNLAANHPDIELSVFFSFGDATELLGEFAEDDQLGGLGCDLQKTPISGLPEVQAKRFLAGLIDGANTLVRDDEEVIEELASLAQIVRTPELSLTHTIDLEHLSRAAAITKITQIGRITRSYEGVV